MRGRDPRRRPFHNANDPSCPYRFERCRWCGEEKDCIDETCDDCEEERR